MIFVNYDIEAPKEALLSNLHKNEEINQAESFETPKGKPKMHIKLKGERLKIKCEMIGGPTKDNGFLEGTYFLGKLKQKNERSSVRGIVLTAPIYHLIFLILLVVVVFQAIKMVAIPITAIFLVLFDLMMFKYEFKKQSIIKRYILRAFKLTYRERENEFTK